MKVMEIAGLVVRMGSGYSSDKERRENNLTVHGRMDRDCCLGEVVVWVGLTQASKF